MGVEGEPIDKVPFYHTTLSVFRSRLLVNDADERVLRATLERAAAAGLFPWGVLENSMGVMGAAPVADTFSLLHQAIAKRGGGRADQAVAAGRQSAVRE